MNSANLHLIIPAATLAISLCGCGADSVPPLDTPPVSQEASEVVIHVKEMSARLKLT
ncbi:MAG: hypothetical protein N2C14_28330 [Planctomycetales bacterium]